MNLGKTNLHRVMAAVLFLAVMSLASPAHALPLNVLASWDFDSAGDVPGSLPAGWSYYPGLSPSPSTPPVQNQVVVGTATSPTNSSQALELEQQTQTYWTQATFPGYSLTAGAKPLSWEADINVASLVNNFSAGFQFKLWTGSSQIDDGFYRVLSASGPTTWNLYAGSFVSAPLNRNQWYHIRVEYTPETSAGTPVVGGSGKVRLYLGNGPGATLLDTENYTGKAASQVNNMSMFTVTSLPNGASPDNIMFLDNVVVSIPEPASLGLMGIGGLLILARRKRA